MNFRDTGSDSLDNYYDHEPVPPHEEEHPPMSDPETDCWECGRDALGGCGCCGAPLCSMHQETQAGFCSNFGDHEVDGETKKGCMIGDEFFEFEDYPESDRDE